jgi:hypothetical protein
MHRNPSDLGHRGTGLDNAWVHYNLQMKMNGGYRSTHVATLAANAIVRAFYGREVSRSYFSGCSTGGRQALHEAQDGIIARATPIRPANLYVMFAWSILANCDSTSRSLLTLTTAFAVLSAFIALSIPSHMANG